MGSLGASSAGISYWPTRKANAAITAGAVPLHNCGHVTRQNAWRAVAPSVRATSSSSRVSVSRTAIAVSVKYGSSFQTNANTSDTPARS